MATNSTLRPLLARYLLPIGLLRPARGDIFLRYSTLQANAEAWRRWMPHYARVHAVLTLVGGLLVSGAVHAGVPIWIEVAAAASTTLELVLAVAFSGAALALRLRAPPRR